MDCNIFKFQIVKALLDAKAPYDLRDADGSTPIYMCAMNGHCDCAELLIQVRILIFVAFVTLDYS